MSQELDFPVPIAMDCRRSYGLDGDLLMQDATTAAKSSSRDPGACKSGFTFLLSRLLSDQAGAVSIAAWGTS